LVITALLKLIDVRLGLIEGLLGLFVATLAVLIAALALKLARSTLLLFSSFPVLFLEVTAHLLHLALSTILLALHLRLEAHALNLLDLAHANLKGVVQVLFLLLLTLFLKLMRAFQSLFLFFHEALKLALRLSGGLHVLLLEDGALLHFVRELLDGVVLGLELVMGVSILQLGRLEHAIDVMMVDLVESFLRVLNKGRGVEVLLSSDVSAHVLAVALVFLPVFLVFFVFLVFLALLVLAILGLLRLLALFLFLLSLLLHLCLLFG